MRLRGKVPASAISLLALTIGIIVGCCGAHAQKAREPARAKAAWHDCQMAPADLAAAIEAARHAFDQSWLADRGNHFAAYRMPGETRSPFDLSPRAPDSGPRDGFVEARPPRCTYSLGQGAEPTHHVRFVSPFYRFYEPGHGWSPPLRDGLMLEVTVTHMDDAWKATAPPSEQTILLPDQAPKRADAAKVPEDTPWAEPIPGCGKRQKWTGVECVASRKR